jgi:hypothetical protein
MSARHIFASYQHDILEPQKYDLKNPIALEAWAPPKKQLSKVPAHKTNIN